MWEIKIPTQNCVAESFPSNAASPRNLDIWPPTLWIYPCLSKPSFSGPNQAVAPGLDAQFADCCKMRTASSGSHGRSGTYTM